MGIYINYSLKAECSDAELLARLKSLRKRLLKLPLEEVGEIERLDPVYNRMCLDRLTQAGFRLPKEIRARLKRTQSKSYGLLCILLGNIDWMDAPKKLVKRFYKPAEEFIKTTKLWNDADLPDNFDYGNIALFCKGCVYELANVMLRRGYLMILNPGEGSETVHLGLSTFGGSTPLWLGHGGTKTQYATHFIDAHENVCHILDCVKEEGLLMSATDGCGYYEHRNWKKAAPIVNLETTFAHAMKGVFAAAIAAASEKGLEIQDLSHPDTWNYNLVHVSDEEESGDSRPAEKKDRKRRRR